MKQSKACKEKNEQKTNNHNQHRSKTGTIKHMQTKSNKTQRTFLTKSRRQMKQNISHPNSQKKKHSKTCK